MSYCRVPGCSKRSAGYSPLCPKHRSRKRRHGHEEQRTIGKIDLKPFIKRVEERIAKQPDANLWSICEQRWNKLAETWKAEPPKTIYAPVRAGAKELVRLADTVSARDVMVTLIAFYLLQDNDPRLFKNETGFRTQLVRAIRSLSGGSFADWDGASDGRKRRAMKELDPHTVKYLSGVLAELLGPAGLKVAQLERKEEEERRQATLAFYAAMNEVT
jgi:hypothetical protein